MPDIDQADQPCCYYVVYETGLVPGLSCIYAILPVPFLIHPVTKEKTNDNCMQRY